MSNSVLNVVKATLSTWRFFTKVGDKRGEQLDECSDDDDMVHSNREGDEEAAGQPEQSINDNGVWNSDEDPDGIEQDYELI